ncbi:DUF2267 domain-containing protein [Chitinophaga sp. SYP-B3965]|uniref:DUF2267 domain-containing protein n=1 Tax=Chitinophaga sp. SYP-B3965 TaxID=2663120 RepID=UPI001299D7D5|nr:DUF2267 domain-containing protein [Chitinophaga sp. SYP-B3965]MRG45319.1 DUF2267 domain-containing protein [Chitinophaga sp. SYP-B3965]
MSGYYDNHAIKGNQLLKELAIELGDGTDISRAARVLRSTLHTLRNYLSTEESLQFISQLPLMIKGVYVDGWTLCEKETASTWEEFKLDVLHLDGLPAEHDFGNMITANQPIAAVFKVLLRYVSGGEMSDILHELPHKLRMSIISLIANRI